MPSPQGGEGEYNLAVAPAPVAMAAAIIVPVAPIATAVIVAIAPVRVAAVVAVAAVAALIVAIAIIVAAAIVTAVRRGRSCGKPTQHRRCKRRGLDHRPYHHLTPSHSPVVPTGPWWS